MTSQNKAIILNFFQLFNEGKTKEAFELVSDKVRWWVAGKLPFSGTKTKSEYLQVVGAIRSGFPGGFKLEPVELTAEDNRVAAEASSSGVHVNGKTYNNKYHFLFHLEDGMIVSVKEYMDTQHLLELISG